MQNKATMRVLKTISSKMEIEKRLNSRKREDKNFLDCVGEFLLRRWLCINPISSLADLFLHRTLFGIFLVGKETKTKRIGRKRK